jgi:TolB-like protein
MTHERYFRASRPTPDRIHLAVVPEADANQLRPEFGGHMTHALSDSAGGEAMLFGRFCLLVRRRELLTDGLPVPIGNRAMDVLIVLVKAHGELVSKDDLLSRVWPNTIVEENNLQFQISTLRKALGEDRDLIKTVTGRGYRFVGEVTDRSSTLRAGEAEDVSGQHSAPAHAAQRAPVVKPSLAVLPFDNLSTNPELDNFADGITKDIVTALSRFRSFSVIACSADRGRIELCRVSEDLGVRYVVGGSVRRAGERLRVTAELTDAPTGVHLWADHFDGLAREEFDFQDRIAESLAGLIEAHVLEAEIERSRLERPESSQAYDLYLQASWQLRTGNPEGNGAAYALLARATMIEPDNGVYLAEAARVIGRALVMGWPPLTADDRAICIHFARRGLTNAGEDASIMATCGLALIHANSDIELGLAMLRRAVEANPNQFRVLKCAGIGQIHCGNFDDGLACLYRALRLSPPSPSACLALSGIAHAKLAMGEYAEAVKWAEESLARSSEYQPTYWMLIAAKAKLGLLDDARRWRDKFLEIAPGATVARLEARHPRTQLVEAFLDGLRLAGLPES